MRYVDVGNKIPSRKINKNKLKTSEKDRARSFLAYGVVFLLVASIAGAIVFFGKDITGLFNPISVVANISPINLEETDGRTNVLILGSDKRTIGEARSELTDTLFVASIGRVEGNVVLISLPRDLWVKTPQGYQTKINSVYALGGSDEITKVVEDVLGIPVHYYAVVNFELFKETIDILGGIEVNVENSFIDYYYPIEGKEKAYPESERYETIRFEAGLQKMDGQTALKYVRSRKGTNNEDTDFARSRRQQKVIMAIRDRFLSLDTLLDINKLKELYDSYSKNIDTNIDFITAQDFFLLSQQLDFSNVRSFVLDDRSLANQGGLLYEPSDKSLYGDVYVLIPKVGDFSQVHAYIQKYVFGDQ